mmetsp:Transcript_35365/g.87892  ORF Transcript_35365/g.87892 Transcript_35365/m.87892 type:complete len:201 (+) Transcript_35365:93-695(+)
MQCVRFRGTYFSPLIHSFLHPVICLSARFHERLPACLPICLSVCPRAQYFAVRTPYTPRHDVLCCVGAVCAVLSVPPGLACTPLPWQNLAIRGMQAVRYREKTRCNARQRNTTQQSFLHPIPPHLTLPYLTLPHPSCLSGSSSSALVPACLPGCLRVWYVCLGCYFSFHSSASLPPHSHTHPIPHTYTRPGRFIDVSDVQ